MKVQKKEVVVFEYELIKDVELKSDLLSHVVIFPELESYLSVSAKGIKFTHYTGIIQTDRFQVNVLPKIWSKEGSRQKLEGTKRNLMQLFTYAVQDPKLFEKYSTLGVGEDKLNIVDFLIRLYSISLKIELEKGLYKTYVANHAIQNYLRGQLILTEQVNKIDKSSFSVREYNYTSENKLNIFFKYSTDLFFKLTTDSVNIRNLELIMNILRTEVNSPINKEEFELHFNRINSRFEAPYSFSKLIQSGKISKSGVGRNTMMFLYDMNQIFERFLYNFLKNSKDRIFENYQEIKIIPQSDGLNFLYEDGRPQRSTIPDIVLRKKDANVLVIDTKYKLIEDSKAISAEDSDVEGNHRINMSDLYQMFTYSEIYGTDVLLVFPNRGRKVVEGPYRFLSDSKQLWIAWLNLDFESTDWEKISISSMKEDFDKILSVVR